MDGCLILTAALFHLPVSLVLAAWGKKGLFAVRKKTTLAPIPTVRALADTP
jgi:hypothetical protein